VNSDQLSVISEKCKGVQTLVWQSSNSGVQTIGRQESKRSVGKIIGP